MLNELISSPLVQFLVAASGILAGIVAYKELFKNREKKLNTKLDACEICNTYISILSDSCNACGAPKPFNNTVIADRLSNNFDKINKTFKKQKYCLVSIPIAIGSIYLAGAMIANYNYHIDLISILKNEIDKDYDFKYTPKEIYVIFISILLLMIYIALYFRQKIKLNKTTSAIYHLSEKSNNYLDILSKNIHQDIPNNINKLINNIKTNKEIILFIDYETIVNLCLFAVYLIVSLSYYAVLKSNIGDIPMWYSLFIAMPFIALQVLIASQCEDLRGSLIYQFKRIEEIINKLALENNITTHSTTDAVTARDS